MKYTYILVFVIITQIVYSQSVGIGTLTPESTALLDLTSNNKGLLTPRMTTAQRLSINNPSNGLIVFDLNTHSFWFKSLQTWVEIESSNAIDSLLTYGKQVSNDSIYLMSDCFDMNRGIMVEAFIIDSSGYIVDDGGLSGNYTDNQDCSIQVFAPINSKPLGLIITIEQMLITGGDELIMSNNDFSYSSIYPQLIDTIYSNDTYFNVGFYSNSSGNDAGYKIHFEFIFAPIVEDSETVIAGGWQFIPSKLSVAGGFNINNLKRNDIGRLSLSYGKNVMAIKESSFAFGENVVNNGAYAVTFGKNVHTNGDYSFSVGESCFANGKYSQSMGRYTYAKGDYSRCFGNALNANGYMSTAIGNGNTSNGSYSITLGSNLFSNGFSGLVVGMYNDSIVNTQNSVQNNTPLFIVGNGVSSNTRSNALVVNKNGRIGVGTNFPDVRFHIDGGTEATLSDATGYQVIGNKDGTNVVFSNTKIQARDDGDSADLSLQSQGGNLVIGNAGTSVRMRGTSIASLTGDGVAIMGSFAGEHLVFGSNEIQVRNGANYADFILQEDGGDVEIGNATSVVRLKGSQEASLTNDGNLVLGASGSVNLNFDGDEIQARNGVGSNTLQIQPAGGITKIGNATTTHYTQILGNDEVSPTSEGILVIGNLTGTNIGFDGNEIIARTGGVSSTLVLQNNGGLLNIGSDVRMDSLVGIGIAPSSYALRLGSDSAGKPGGGSWTNSSDIRLKQDIKPYKSGLQDVIQINPITYHYNEKSGFDTKPEYVGIIAQELKEIAPYMVGKYKHNGEEYFDVNNSAMTYMLINAVKELV
jgi:hypothetical protein